MGCRHPARLLALDTSDSCHTVWPRVLATCRHHDKLLILAQWLLLLLLQARRTKTSSPLGQLFDHGCDALSVNLLLANIAVSLSMPCGWAHGIGNFGVSAPRRAHQGAGGSRPGLGTGMGPPPARAASAAWRAGGAAVRGTRRCAGGQAGRQAAWLTERRGALQVMFTWILAQWEEYHTGIMLYGNSFYGVLEANYSISAIHILTYIAGPAFWRQTVGELLPQLASYRSLQHLRGWRSCCAAMPCLARRPLPGRRATRHGRPGWPLLHPPLRCSPLPFAAPDHACCNSSRDQTHWAWAWRRCSTPAGACLAPCVLLHSVHDGMHTSRAAVQT